MIASRIVSYGGSTVRIHGPSSSLVATRNISGKPLSVSKISFEDHKLAYRSKTTSEVLRSLLVLGFCKHEFLVDHSDKFIKFGRRILGTKLLNKLMKATVFGQFVAGENEQEFRPLIQRLKKFGVSIILNFAVEDDEQGGEQKKSGVMIQTKKSDENPGDRNLLSFMKTIDNVAETTNGAGFCAIKVTALTRPETLVAITNAIQDSQKFVNSLFGQQPKATVTATSMTLSGVQKKLIENGYSLENPAVTRWLNLIETNRNGLLIDSLNWKNILNRKMTMEDLCWLPNNAKNKTTASQDQETEELHSLSRRMDALGEHAHRRNVRVLVDAEQSYFQPAIARYSLELMRKYNVDRPSIYNTYQCYLRDAYINVLPHLELSRQEGFMFGAKVVRGAYIVLERERARLMQYPDPINPNFEATSRMYESVVGTILEDIVKRGERSNIVIAGHNEATVRWAVQKLEELGLPKKMRQVYFGQLLGMCDQLSFTLANTGYNVVKCMPFGSVEEVLPYLIRRAHENRGFMDKTTKERRLLRREFLRRLRSGQLFYDPNAASNSSGKTEPM